VPAVLTTPSQSPSNATSSASRWPTIRRSTVGSHQNPLPVRSLPKKEVSSLLVKEFFVDVGFIHNVMHAPTMLRQVEDFHACVEGNLVETVEPGWLAVYYMVHPVSQAALARLRLPHR
jgi:hypothetical protein